jgi:Transposase IS66 family
LDLGWGRFLTYFNVEHALPYDRLSQITQDLLGFAVSEGTIANKLTRMQEQAKGIIGRIKQFIVDASFIGSDETSTSRAPKKVLGMGLAVPFGFLLCDCQGAGICCGQRAFYGKLSRGDLP